MCQKALFPNKVTFTGDRDQGLISLGAIIQPIPVVIDEVCFFRLHTVIFITAKLKTPIVAVGERGRLHTAVARPETRTRHRGNLGDWRPLDFAFRVTVTGSPPH